MVKTFRKGVPPKKQVRKTLKARGPKMVRLPNTITVKPSKLHGKGAFTVKALKKDEVVLCFDPEILMTQFGAQQLPQKDQQYVTHVKGVGYVLLVGPERYINHSCEPNAYAKGTCVVAAKEIKRGEEVTTNYCCDRVMLGFPCKCKNNTCIGSIEGISSRSKSASKNKRSIKSKKRK
jgi:hypothetical protein